MPDSLFKKTTIAITALITILMVGGIGLKKWSMHGDALGYYMYLPATFIYHNNTALDSLPYTTDISNHVYVYINNLKLNRTPKGYVLDQYTFGMAFMEMPFFFIAHAYEKILSRPASGYSDTYNYMLLLCSLFYAAMGLLIVYKILKNYFGEVQSLLGTIIIFIGTNLLYFSTIQGGMAHPVLFFLYASLIYFTIKLHAQPKTFSFVLCGMAAGMITVIRPTDILCLLIPLFYNIYNWETIRNKVTFLKENMANAILFTFAFIAPVIPQLLYWKYISGHFLYYSYGQQSFDWRHPKIIEGLFYYSNGWLPYAPVMIFSIAGMFLYKPLRKWAWAIWLFFPVYIYIIYSWYCYRYINGLGSRPMINIYPLLALPLTAFIQLITRQKLFIKIVFTSVGLLFIAINISYCVQQGKGVIWSEESNMTFNLQMLFRMHLHYDDLVVHDIGERQPDTSKLTKIGTIGYQNFGDSVSEHFVKADLPENKYVYKMRDEEYKEAFVIPYNKEIFKGAKWFKCTGRFMYPERPGYFKHVFVLDVSQKKWVGCTIENKINGPDPGFYRKNDIDLNYSASNVWGTVYYFTKIPANIKDGDGIKVYVWNIGRTPLFIDAIRLELYK